MQTHALCWAQDMRKIVPFFSAWGSSWGCGGPGWGCSSHARVSLDLKKVLLVAPCSVGLLSWSDLVVCMAECVAVCIMHT
jgi:hypothetical protein